MVNTQTILQEIMNHPTVRSEMPMQMLLGLPYLEKKSEKLCMRFCAHREEYKNSYVEYFPAQYQLSFVYPFKKICYFSNLTLEQGVDASKPVCRVEATQLTDRGIAFMKELYAACDRVLSFQEKDGKVTDLSITKYQNAFWETVKKLGLEELYRDFRP